MSVRWWVLVVAAFVGGFRASADEIADDVWTVHASPSRHSPVAGKRGPGQIHLGALVGWTGEPSADERDRPRWFTAMPPGGTRWTSVVVGVSDRPPVVVTGLRLDYVGPDGHPGRIVVGDRQSVWGDPVSWGDGPPPVGLVAASGHVIDRLGFRMTDGSVSTEFGGAGGDVRQTAALTGPDAGGRVLGLAGTVTTFAGRPAIERVGMLFRAVSENDPGGGDGDAFGLRTLLSTEVTRVQPFVYTESDENRAIGERYRRWAGEGRLVDRIMGSSVRPLPYEPAMAEFGLSPEDYRRSLDPDRRYAEAAGPSFPCRVRFDGDRATFDVPKCSDGLEEAAAAFVRCLGRTTIDLRTGRLTYDGIDLGTVRYQIGSSDNQTADRYWVWDAFYAPPPAKDPRMGEVANRSIIVKLSDDGKTGRRSITFAEVRFGPDGEVVEPSNELFGWLMD